MFVILMVLFSLVLMGCTTDTDDGGGDPVVIDTGKVPVELRGTWRDIDGIRPDLIFTGTTVNRLTETVKQVDDDNINGLYDTKDEYPSGYRLWVDDTNYIPTYSNQINIYFNSDKSKIYVRYTTYLSGVSVSFYDFYEKVN